MRTSVAFLLLVVALGACSSDEAVELPASRFINYGAAPLSHTLYMGSDATFHYFAWESGSSSGGWKIRKTDMPFCAEVPSTRTGLAIVKNQSGAWQPYGLCRDAT